MRRRVVQGVGAGLLCSLAAIVTALGTFTMITVLPATPVAAQDEEAAAAPEGEAAAKPEKSLLVWTYESLGWQYTIAFLAMSFSAVALVVMLILTGRRDSFCPTHLVQGFEAHVSEKRYQEAYDLAKADESVLGLILAAGMAQLQNGYDKAQAAMQQVGEDENMKIEQRLSYLSLIGGLAPMVGLLGTVHGMIMSFEVIASSDTTPKPSMLAQGVSTALFTTLVGLLVAIPVIGIFTYFKNRFARMMFDVGVYVGELMGRFEKGTP